MSKKPQEISIILDVSVECPHCGYWYSGDEVVGNCVEIDDLFYSYGGQKTGNELEIVCWSCGDLFEVVIK